MLPILGAHALAALLAPLLVRWFGRNAFYLLALVPAGGLAWAIGAWNTAAVIDREWVPALGMDFVFRYDSLAQILVVLVLGVGALVLVYCARYFEDDEPRLGLFAAELVAFAGAMFGLVLSDNMLLLYVFWEITSVLSFLLVGHYAERASSRASATKALLVTTFGGLAMLVGIVALGQSAGTYLLSELVFAPPTGTLVSVAIALILIGALSKSAIVPMHFWLPGAMAAPTPVSAYLHAAAMVKAGIFLIARLAPGFAEDPVWRPMVLSLGSATLILAGWRALREFDLKLILAFGTVSQLGFMTVLVGLGTYDAALAGLAVVVAHALFKSSLFMVIGAIDHTTGTRDVRELSGLGRASPAMAVIAVAAAASMAGVPPFIGFVGKEAAFSAMQESPVTAWVLLAALTIGSALTVAYTLRVLSGAFADKGARPSAAVRTMSRPEVGLLAAPALLAAGGLAAGLAPGWIDRLLTPYARTLPATDGHPYHLALWHGWNLPLALTAVVFVVGGALFAAHRRLAFFRGATPPLGNADRAYDWSLRTADRVSLRMTAATQRGSLPLTQGIIVTTMVALPLLTLAVFGAPELDVRWTHMPWQLLIGLLMIIPAVVATVLRNRLAAVLTVGFTGYGIAMIFALHGAPDLALTQFLVETLLLVVFVLVLRKLPAENPRRIEWSGLGGAVRGLRVTVAIAAGATVAALGAVAMAVRTAPGISELMPEAAYERGGGRNVVNVLLVDIRAWDTFGEVTVLMVAATGVASLVFRHHRFGAALRVSDAEKMPLPPNLPADRAALRPSTTRLRGIELTDPRFRSLVLEMTTRLVFPTVMVLSVYFFFAGHNQPGGGFAGGLTAGLAVTLRYLAGGRYEIGETLPVDAGKLLGVGLLFCAGTAGFSLLIGAPVLSSTIWDVTLPVFGDIHIASALFFDLGVYLIVLGVVLDILRSLGARLDSKAEVKLQ